MASVVQLGTTAPLSLTSPTASETVLNDELKSYLEVSMTIFESESGQTHREVVLKAIENILLQWTADLAASKEIPDELAQNGGGIQLKVFGSQRLGVHTPTADIDLLCIAPSFVTRDDFFGSFCDVLAAKSEISLLLPIPEAYTPVLKFDIYGQAIDMIFVSLSCDKVPMDIQVSDGQYLKGLDDKGIRSINGSRVAERILNLVPNLETFCLALRTVKHWARRRGLYSNVLGFLGGVNFALLVAFICQRYPNACAAVIVKQFFVVFCQWRWPNPVLLCSIDATDIGTAGDGRFIAVWNPKLNPKDGQHMMPIITPSFPAMNSAYNVGLPQFRLWQEEIQRGQEICIKHTRASDAGGASEVGELAGEFFSRYPRYVQVDISATTVLEHRRWFGWCESRLRLLISSLEQPPFMYCHPHANCFHRQEPVDPPKGEQEKECRPNDANTRPEVDEEDENMCGSKLESEAGVDANNFLYTSSFFIGLSFKNGLRSADLTVAAQDFQRRVWHWEGKTVGMTLNIEPRCSKSIPKFVYETTAEPSCSTACTPQTHTHSKNAKTAVPTSPGLLPNPKELFPTNPYTTTQDDHTTTRSEGGTEDVGIPIPLVDSTTLTIGSHIQPTITDGLHSSGIDGYDGVGVDLEAKDRKSAFPIISDGHLAPGSQSFHLLRPQLGHCSNNSRVPPPCTSPIRPKSPGNVLGNSGCREDCMDGQPMNSNWTLLQQSPIASGSGQGTQSGLGWRGDDECKEVEPEPSLSISVERDRRIPIPTGAGSATRVHSSPLSQRSAGESYSQTQPHSFPAFSLPPLVQSASPIRVASRNNSGGMSPVISTITTASNREIQPTQTHSSCFPHSSPNFDRLSPVLVLNQHPTLRTNTNQSEASQGLQVTCNDAKETSEDCPYVRPSTGTKGTNGGACRLPQPSPTKRIRTADIVSSTSSTPNSR